MRLLDWVEMPAVAANTTTFPAVDLPAASIIPSALFFVQIDYADGPRDVYQIPLALSTGPDANDVIETYGRIDYLVNNAGINVDRTVRRMTVDAGTLDDPHDRSRGGCISGSRDQRPYREGIGNQRRSGRPARASRARHPRADHSWSGSPTAP